MNKQYNLTEIAKHTKCKLVRGDGQQMIGMVSPLDEGEAGQLIFWIKSQKDKKFLLGTKASAIIVADRFLAEAQEKLPISCAILSTLEPEYSFIECLSLYHPPTYGGGGIHEKAIISATAKLGKDVTVAPGAVIGDNVVIADKCYIGAGAVLGADVSAGVKVGQESVIKSKVVIEANTYIGSRVVIHSGTVIGTDGFGYMRYDGVHRKIPHLGGVIIEEDVEVGANTTIDRGTMGYTRIGAGTKIDNQCQVGHNTIIGKNCILCGATAIAGSVTIEDDCIFAGKSGCIHDIKVAKGTIVHAGAIVVKDTQPKARISGFRGSDSKEYLKELAAIKRLANEQ